MNDQDRKERSVRRDIVFVFALALPAMWRGSCGRCCSCLYVCGLFAVVFAPLVESVSALRVGRRQPFRHIAVLVLLLGSGGVLALFCALALPPVMHDLVEFSKEAPSRTPILMDQLRHIPFADQIDADDLDARIQDWASKSATYVLLSLKNWASALFDAIMGIILTSTSSWRGMAPTAGFSRSSRRLTVSGWTARCGVPRSVSADGCWGREA